MVLSVEQFRPVLDAVVRDGKETGGVPGDGVLLALVRVAGTCDPHHLRSACNTRLTT